MNEGQCFLFAAAAENTVMANADKSLWQNVQGEPSNELGGIQGHDLSFIFITIVLVAKAHLAIGEADDSMIGDGDLVGVSAQIFDHLLWPAEGPFGINHPWRFEQRIIERAILLGELPSQGGHEPGAEHRTEGFDGEEKFSIAARLLPVSGLGQPACRHDAVQVRMQGEVLSPGVEDGNHAGVSAEMLLIVGERFHDIPNRVEEQTVEPGRFKQRQTVERLGQGEDHMKIRCRKQLRFSGEDPPLALYLLAFRAMSVAARVIAHANMATTGA